MSEYISRYQYIAENTLDLICETSADGRYTYLSPNYREVLGYAPEEMLGRPFGEWLHPDDAPAVLERFAENMRSLQPGQATFRYRRKDGTWRWLETTGKPMTSDEGGLRAIFVSRDITERKLAEEHAARSEERLRVVVNRTPVIIFAIDRDGVFTLSEGKGLRALGQEPGEAVGVSAFQLYKDYPRIIGNLRCALAGETFSDTVEVRDLVYETLHIPTRDAEGAVIGLFGFALDVTERRRIEEDRLQTSKLQSLALLAGGIAHDFNNLLTSILGNLSLAEMKLERDSEVIAQLHETEEACLRARDLTVQLLTFAHGGAPVKKNVALPEVIRRAASVALRGSNVTCEFSISEDLWPVHADESQISQVFQNLLVNAQQAMPGGGTVRVKACNALATSRDQCAALTLQQDSVEIVVEDRGVGITPENLDRIFEPYFTTKSTGHGLGLAAAYSILKTHGGGIHVTSTPGEGTKFCIYLPAARRATPESEDGKGEVHELHEAHGRVLVMDDEELIRMLASRMLSGFGYEVECAQDGREAIAKYSEALDAGKRFDVVILDLTIRAGMGGFETLQELRILDPEVKAIVSSGYSSNPVMAEFEAHGVAGVVPKPYRTRDLVGAVQRILER